MSWFGSAPTTPPTLYKTILVIRGKLVGDKNNEVGLETQCDLATAKDNARKMCDFGITLTLPTGWVVFIPADTIQLVYFVPLEPNERSPEDSAQKQNGDAGVSSTVVDLGSTTP